MTKRMLAALSAVVALVGQAFAQAPPGAVVEPAPTVTEGPAMAVPADFVDAPRPGQTGQFWVTADYLMAWIRGQQLTPLVTTSPTGTDRTVAGVLGQGATSALFGSNTVNNDIRSGFQLGAGFWFSSEQTLGFEAGFSMIESQSTLFSATSDGTTILARPFRDANTDTQQAVLIAFPGSSSGAVDVRVNSNNFYEAHFDLAERFVNTGRFQMDSLLGYRFYRYDEGLRIRQSISPTDPTFVPGTQIVSTDNFTTQNQFHGLDLGLRAGYTWDRLSINVLVKVALGRVSREDGIHGTTTTTVPGAMPATQLGGVYALSSNSGTFPNGDWTALPEFGLNLNLQLNQYTRLRMGYSLLLLGGVNLAVEQVDTTINPNLFPTATNPGSGPSRPSFNFVKSEVWLQSINIGLEFSF